MVLAIAFVVMLPLYRLISKRILYNIPIGEKIFLFQNDFAYISLNKFELLYHLLLAFPSQNIFINNINHLIIFISQAIKIHVFLQTYYYGVYTNVQSNQYAKRLCSH